MRRPHIGSLIVVLMMVVYLASALFATPASLGTGEAGSSFSTGPTGLRALYSLLATSKSTAVRIETEPETGLDAVPILLISQPVTDDSRHTAQAWLAQARAGSRLVIVSNKPDALSQALGLTVSPVQGEKTYDGSLVTKSVHVNASMQHVSFTGPLVKLAGARESDTLISLNFTSPVRQRVLVGLHRRFGRGSVTWLTIPALLTNAQILRADNLSAVLTLLGQGRQRVGFVETVHGYTLVPGALSVLGSGFAYAFWFAVVALLIRLWSAGQRFGPPLPSRRPGEPAQAALAQAVGMRARSKKDWRVLWDAYATWAALHLPKAEDPPALLTDRDVVSNRSFLAHMAEATRYLDHHETQAVRKYKIREKEPEHK